MQIEKKYWLDMLDADSADFRVMQNAYINMNDFRFGPTSDKGFAEQLESVGGTISIPVTLPDGQNYCIGYANDYPNRRIVYFNWNEEEEHGIYCFDFMTNTINIVLLASQVTGGLSFDKYHLIHSARIENGNVYWTDFLNPPRRIDIDAGIRMNKGVTPPPTGLDPFVYIAPLSQSVIAWIRRQPGLPPAQTKVLEDPPPGTNFIKDEAFEFAYRYQYRGFEYSTLSALSTLADFDEQDPSPTETSLNVPNNNLVTNGYLATNILLPPTPTPGYGPDVQMKITRAGTTGPNSPAIDIAIPLNWTGYPASRSYTRVIVEGLNEYFRVLPGNGSTGQLTIGNLPQSLPQSGNWYISYRDGQHPTLNIWHTWDWGLGDSAFPPTTEANVTLFTSTPAPSRQFNRIDVNIPLAEKIDQDVIQVDMVANYLVSGIYFIIKSWKEAIPADAAAIAAHNAGTTPLTYNFYNVQAGIALSAPYSIKPYDSVPLLCQTIEMAKNRGFMGNFLIGYNSSALTTSLSANFTLTTLGAPPGNAIVGEWFLFRFYNGNQVAGNLYTEYIIRTTIPVFTPTPPQAYYYYTYQNAAPPFPQTITTGIIFIGNTLDQCGNYYLGVNNDFGPPYFPNIIDENRQSALVPNTQTINFGVLSRAFKSNSSYQLSISYLDNYGRKSGIVTNGGLLITIPNTAFSANQYVTALNWSLSTLDQLAEIPDWAYYYSINITKCLRTRFFVQAFGFIIYVRKDATDTYQFDETIYSTDLAGVGVDISFLASNGLGYVFAAGDVVNFYLAGAYYSLGVIGQSGKYIIAELYNVGPLGAGSQAQYEIYTPYKQSTDEPYFEVAQIYLIANPGTAQRQFSNAMGTISGDVFVFQRSNNLITYLAEAMSPNKKYYTLWLTDAGRPNFTDSIGQVKKISSIAYSNTFIAGSQDNGLSTFDALDTEDLSPDFGAIMKLQLASKVQKIGTIMLAICNGYSTASLYLSENTLITNTGESFVAQSNAVIGQVHELKGEFGTLNPESVFEFRGNVYWVDIQNGKVIQYADNGLYPVSNYKMSRYWKLFSDQYKSMTPQQIEALGNRPFIFGMADPHHGEILFTVPRTLEHPPVGYLPDYPGEPYPFDIWDGRGKTLVYKLYTDPNHWQGGYRFVPEYLFYLENSLYAFKNGQLFLHNNPDPPFCNYYGEQWSPEVMFLSNQQLNKPKVYNNFSVEGNEAPTLAYFMSLYEFLQSSDLVTDDFANKEGVFYAPIYRNKLDPAFNQDFPAALIAGEKMRTTALYIMGRWDATQGIVQIKFCNIGYTLSVGQKV